MAKYKSSAVFALFSNIFNYECKICTLRPISYWKIFLKAWSVKKFLRTFSNLASSKKTALVLRLGY